MIFNYKILKEKLLMILFCLSGQLYFLPFNVTAQISLCPKIGLLTDGVSSNRDDWLIFVDSETSYLVPVYMLSARYDLESNVFMAIEGAYSYHERRVYSKELFFDPYNRMNYNSWGIVFSAGYSFPSGFSIDGGIGLTILDTRRICQLYSGWSEDEWFSNTNILGAKLNGGYEYKNWIISVGAYFPVKGYSSNSLIKNRSAFEITLGRLIQVSNLKEGKKRRGRGRGQF